MRITIFLIALLIATPASAQRRTTQQPQSPKKIPDYGSGEYLGKQIKGEGSSSKTKDGSSSRVAADNKKQERGYWETFLDWVERHPREAAGVGVLSAFITIGGLVVGIATGAFAKLFLFLTTSSYSRIQESVIRVSDAPDRINLTKHQEATYLNRRRQKIYCPQCDGKGKIAGIKCRKCDGRATIYTNRLGQPKCRLCNGNGKIAGIECKDCDGVGLMRYEYRDEDKDTPPLQP